MSKKYYFKTVAVAIALAAMALPAQGQKRTDVDGNGRTEIDDMNMVINEMLHKSPLRYVSDLLQVDNPAGRTATAHYVGNSIIVDFDITNASGIDLNSVEIMLNSLSTDAGTILTTYNDISVGEGQPYSERRLTNLVFANGETRPIRIRLSDNALSMVPRFMNIKLYASAQQFGELDDNYINLTVPVTDERVTSDAMWTNDDHMTFTYPTMARDGNDLLATITITNNVGRDIINGNLRFDSVNNGNGVTYSTYQCYFIVDGNSNERVLRNFPIDNGETREVTLRVKDFFQSTPRALNATIAMESDNYTFANEYFYAISVKIPDSLK